MSLHYTPPAEMYGAGSNIDSRAETVQVNNANANKYWFTETVYSANRDVNVFPNPNQYVVPLSRKYKNVLQVELLSAEIPVSPYIIECRDPSVKNTGNNSFRFNEGYIIDDGTLYGIVNDRVRIREYSDSSVIRPVQQQNDGVDRFNPANPCNVLCEPGCQTSQVVLPHTLTKVAKVELLSEHEVLVTTCDKHHMTCRYNPIIYLVDVPPSTTTYSGPVTVPNVNGQYRMDRVCDEYSFVAVACERDLHHQSPPHDNDSKQDQEEGVGCRRHCSGWVYWPRVSSPHDLAQLVQDYINERSEPRVMNRYSVTFDDKIGRFIVTRSFGVELFDLLAGSDRRSILSETMGFSPVDYAYGQYDHLTNNSVTRLPSDMLSVSIRPDVQSESVGESARVAISRGNYGPEELAETITVEMQRPIIEKGINDVLVVQLLGQNVKLCLPCGMYDPDNLIQAIAHRMNEAYHCIIHGDAAHDQFTGDVDEKSSQSPIRGTYHLKEGSFCLEAVVCDVRFGLLFSQSTIGPLLGFEPDQDLTGDSSYASLNSVFFPVANRRYTDQLYSMTAHVRDMTFRFTKNGAYQAPIVSITATASAAQHDHNDESCDDDKCDDKCGGVVVHTWTPECGGCAHGFQVGDLMTIDGAPSGGSDSNCDVVTSPALIGLHVVKKVLDAFSFVLDLTLVSPMDGEPSECLFKTIDCDACPKGPPKGPHKKGPKKAACYVASHWFQPFNLFFPGVKDNIGAVLGYPHCLSGCVDYVGKHQWMLNRQRDVYININELCNTDNGRICKTSDSGQHSKYSYSVHNSFVRVPLSLSRQAGIIEFGLLSSSSYQRKHRFTTNTTELNRLTISLVDQCGDSVNFHGRDHTLDIRILVER